MIVVRFRVTAKPDRTEELCAAFEADVLAAAPEATVYEVSSSKPWGA